MHERQRAKPDPFGEETLKVLHAVDESLARGGRRSHQAGLLKMYPDLAEEASQPVKHDNQIKPNKENPLIMKSHDNTAAEPMSSWESLEAALKDLQRLCEAVKSRPEPSTRPYQYQNDAQPGFHGLIRDKQGRVIGHGTLGKMKPLGSRAG
jgi:hypothetical protein